MSKFSTKTGCLAHKITATEMYMKVLIPRQLSPHKKLNLNLALQFVLNYKWI